MEFSPPQNQYLLLAYQAALASHKRLKANHPNKAIEAEQAVVELRDELIEAYGDLDQLDSQTRSKLYKEMMEFSDEIKKRGTEKANLVEKCVRLAAFEFA